MLNIHTVFMFPCYKNLMDKQVETINNSNKYAGGTPAWKILLSYLIFAGLIYGLVYYLFLRKAPVYSGPTNQTNTNVIIPPSQDDTNNGGTSSDTNPPVLLIPSTEPSNKVAPTTGPTTSTNSFTVVAGQQASNPQVITVNNGSQVQITFQVDQDTTSHGGLEFRSPMVSTGVIKPGTSKTVKFTASKSFSFTPYWPDTNEPNDYTIDVVVK